MADDEGKQEEQQAEQGQESQKEQQQEQAFKSIPVADRNDIIHIIEKPALGFEIKTPDAGHTVPIPSRRLKTKKKKDEEEANKNEQEDPSVKGGDGTKGGSK